MKTPADLSPVQEAESPDNKIQMERRQETEKDILDEVK